MPKKRDINKVKAVSKVYMNNGLNMAEALKEVEGNKDYKHDNSINVKASRWKMSPEIQAQIRTELALFDEKIANKTYCIINLVEIINDKTTKTSDRVNAVNTLAKLIGYAEQGNTTNITFDITSLKTIPVKSIPIIDNNKDIITT
jgi:hypothetical protein